MSGFPSALAAVALGTLTLLSPAAQDSAAGPTGARLDDLTSRVASQLRCPVCRNQSVLESSAQLSRQMQAEIRRRLAAGESPEEVKAYFVSRYGEWILLRPEPSGLNLLVYLLPAAAVVAGLVAVGWQLRRWMLRPAESGGSPAEGEDEREHEGAGLTAAEERRIDRLVRRDAGEDPEGT